MLDNTNHLSLTDEAPVATNLDLSLVDLNTSSQIQLELLYAKYQLISCLSQEFVAAGAIEQLEELEIPIEFGIDLLVQMYLHKRAEPQVLVGLLRKHFLDDPSIEDPEQACADMLIKACEGDVIDHAMIWVNDPESTGRVRKHIFVVKHDGISQEVQDRIAQFQYPLPMVEEPSQVRHNRQTGYRTIKGSLILKKNHHDEDICLDHINRVNQIPLAVNADVVAFVQNRWKNLDKKKPGESDDKFKARKRAFEKYDFVSREVIEAMLAHGNKFWLTHRYDKRGRTYSQGYHINYQGADWNKACVEFAKAETLNQE